MRSEDRKPSKRVFPLLQNLDLDTVTFANVQGVGDPITIEDMNEQELQDLVLVGPRTRINTMCHPARPGMVQP